MIKNKKNGANRKANITLRQLSEYVGLTPGTVSVVLNHAPSSKSIPQHTKDRIFAAATKLKYRPNLLARSLRTGQLHTAGVTMTSDDIGKSFGALVITSAEHLSRALHAIQSVGLRVPDDVSVVGFDEIPPAMFARPVSGAEVHPP